MEDYVCKCGLVFGSLEDLQEHWTNSNRANDLQHYRAGKSGGRIDAARNFETPPDIGKDPR
jgi:hypothetical protein